MSKYDGRFYATRSHLLARPHNITALHLSDSDRKIIETNLKRVLSPEAIRAQEEGLLVCTSNTNKRLQPWQRMISPKKVVDRPLRKQSKYMDTAKKVQTLNASKGSWRFACQTLALCTQ
jgi:hypothetical protein